MTSALWSRASMLDDVMLHDVGKADVETAPLNSLSARIVGDRPKVSSRRII